MASVNDIRRIVIIGAGLAGASAAEELRKLGYDASVTLIGSEQHPPYERPTLSKSVLAGTATRESTLVHPVEWYVEQGIDLVTGTNVTRLDLASREVALPENQVLDFDRLLLSTGARPRRFDLADAANAAGAEVLYLRTLSDAERLRDRLEQRLLIVGGGWIGLEVAAAARTAGGTVTLVEAADLPLVGVLGPEVATVFADLHRDHGVDLRTGTTVAAIKHDGGRTLVRLSDGEQIEVDLLVVGIGAEPDIDLAQTTGLKVENGILVDSRLCTSAPGMFAAGDVANHDHPDLGRLRVEHWDNAIEQGRHVARSMLGATTPYTRQPYFYTDQYDLGMEYLGHVGPKGYDEVSIRGDLERRVFTAWWIRDRTIVAGMHTGDWDAIHQIRQLVGKPATDLPQ